MMRVGAVSKLRLSVRVRSDARQLNPAADVTNFKGLYYVQFIFLKTHVIPDNQKIYFLLLILLIIRLHTSIQGRKCQ